MRFFCCLLMLLCLACSGEEPGQAVNLVASDGTADVDSHIGAIDVAAAVDAPDVAASDLAAIEVHADAEADTNDLSDSSADTIPDVSDSDLVDSAEIADQQDADDDEADSTIEIDIVELQNNKSCVDKCKDTDPCTVDLCDIQTGCYYKPVICDDTDNNNCTDEVCEKNKGCVNIANSSVCTDDNPCTFDDVCKFGGCVGVVDLCNDSNACTQDSCEKSTGCVHISVKCLDNEICTDNTCDKQKGCVFPFNTVSCNDSNLCTSGDSCSQGMCMGTTPVDCDDKNVCTVDACDQKLGCTHMLKDSKECDDGNECTIDVCDAKIGCVNSGKQGSCSDGSQCTKEDICVSGACKTGAVCDDKNPCTIDTCTNGVGCTFTPKGPVFADNFESGSAKSEWVFDPKYWKVSGPGLNGQYAMRLAFHEPGKIITLVLKVPPMKTNGKLMFLWVADGWKSKSGVTVKAQANYLDGGVSAGFGVGSSATLVKDGISPSSEIVFTIFIDSNTTIDVSKFAVRIDDFAIWEPISCSPD